MRSTDSLRVGLTHILQLEVGVDHGSLTDLPITVRADPGHGDLSVGHRDNFSIAGSEPHVPVGVVGCLG